MPFNRRFKYLLALVALAFFTTLYFSNDAHHPKNAVFYEKTKLALEKSAEDKRLKAEADAQLQNILKHAKDLASGDNVAEVAKENPLPDAATFSAEDAKKMPPPPPGSDEDVDHISVAGRKTMRKPKHWAVGKDEEVALNGGRLEKVEEPGMEEAKAELNIILKKSPGMSISANFTARSASLIENLTNVVIIFSKSTCPSSRRAKSLLLDTYKILPTPYVVELDHLNQPISDPNDDSPPTLGRKLQDLLAASTGRETVPNILINGRSIGGGDEVMKLDADGELIKKIRDMGGRWVQEVERRGGPDTLPRARGM
jgi:glutaredoxin